MLINNPFQMNDWEIKKFLSVVLTIQLTLLGLICIEAIGFKIAILRQLVGFIYLTFIPGLIILRVLRLHKLDSVETLLYAVGLSVATLMFIGLFMNTVYPVLGISEPISAGSLTTTLTVLVIALCLISYIRDRDFANTKILEIKFSPSMLFLCLLPFLTIIGAFLINFYDNNVVLIFSIAIIAILFPIQMFKKFVSNRMYPLLIFAVAISLLFHTWLITSYIWGRDIHSEYYYSNIVITNSYWNPTSSSTAVNSMLSVTMLAPFYSLLCNVDLTWVYKVIYPFFFSLIFVVLYQIFQNQANDDKAFLACFFAMSFGLYDICLISVKQNMGHFFITLLTMLLIEEKIVGAKKRFLLVVFSFALVVSHYGVAYLYLFCLITAWSIMLLMKRSKGSKGLNIKRSTISLTFLLFYITLILAWYIYTSSSAAFSTIVNIINHIASGIYDILTPEAAEGLYLALQQPTTMSGYFHKYLVLFTQFLIAIGVLTLLVKKDENSNFGTEYLVLSLAAFSLCILSILLPYFSSAIYTLRLYNMTLLFLAPFCIEGWLSIIQISRKYLQALMGLMEKNKIKVLSIILMMLFLFQTGFVDEIIKDPPSSKALSSKMRYLNSQDVKTRAFFYWDYVFDQEICGTTWLAKHMREGVKVWADSTATHLRSYGMLEGKIMLLFVSATPSVEAYVYLGYGNVVDKILFNIVLHVLERGYLTISIDDVNKITPLLENMNRIYSNGACEIYYREK